STAGAIGTPSGPPRVRQSAMPDFPPAGPEAPLEDAGAHANAANASAASAASASPSTHSNSSPHLHANAPSVGITSKKPTLAGTGPAIPPKAPPMRARMGSVPPPPVTEREPEPDTQRFAREEANANAHANAHANERSGSGEFIDARPVTARIDLPKRTPS